MLHVHAPNHKILPSSCFSLFHVKYIYISVEYLEYLNYTLLFMLFRIYCGIFKFNYHTFRCNENYFFTEFFSRLPYYAKLYKSLRVADLRHISDTSIVVYYLWKIHEQLHLREYFQVSMIYKHATLLINVPLWIMNCDWPIIWLWHRYRGYEAW